MRREESLSGKIWKKSLIADFLRGFFSSTFDLLEGAVENFIQEQQKRIFKKLSIILGFFIGAVFLLNSLALFISDYLEKSSWVGYGVVGGVLILLAFIFRKE